MLTVKKFRSGGKNDFSWAYLPKSIEEALGDSDIDDFRKLATKLMEMGLDFKDKDLAEALFTLLGERKVHFSFEIKDIRML